MTASYDFENQWADQESFGGKLSIEEKFDLRWENSYDLFIWSTSFNV